MLRRLLAVVALVALAASPVSGQGRQSGALGGCVSSSDGQPLPGASVSVVSTALQGTRVVVADVNGVYRLDGPPRGRLRRDLRDERHVLGRAAARRISLGGEVTIDQQLTLEPVREVINVRGATPGAGGLADRRVQPPRQRYRRCCRRPARPSCSPSSRPGLTDNTPNSNQVTIGGGLRLRQRVPDERRRHQRQRARTAKRRCSSKRRSRRCRC